MNVKPTSHSLYHPITHLLSIGEAAYWLTDILAGLIVLLQAIFVVGLRVLAENMSDPFGNDVDNLSVLHYINFTWQTSVQMLLAKRPRPVDKATEEHLCVLRPPLGKPWNDVNKDARLRSAHISADGFELEEVLPDMTDGTLSSSPSSYNGSPPHRFSVEKGTERDNKEKEKDKSKRKRKEGKSVGYLSVEGFPVSFASEKEKFPTIFSSTTNE